MFFFFGIIYVSLFVLITKFTQKVLGFWWWSFTMSFPLNVYKNWTPSVGPGPLHYIENTTFKYAKSSYKSVIPFFVLIYSFGFWVFLNSIINNFFNFCLFENSLSQLRSSILCLSPGCAWSFLTASQMISYMSRVGR